MLARNMATGKLEYKKVIALTRPHQDHLLELKIEGEHAAIETTPLHPFWVKRAGSATWITAGKMHAGDQVLTEKGEWEKVTEDISLNKLATVYNFEVQDDHDYFVGALGLLVHNDGPCSTPFTGYRAVNDQELYNINDNNEFQPSPTGSESKYFFNSEGQAWDFGNRMYGEGNFGVVQGDFPASTPIEMINPATEGPGFVVPNEFLPTGTPTIIWP